MHKREKPQVKEDISPNLIPMIDIMFLLLLFFMLGADMGARENAELNLPQADKVKEDDNKVVAEGLTTINVHHDPGAGVKCAVADNGGTCREASHWKWQIHGKDYERDKIRSQIQIEAELSMETDVDPVAKKRLSARKVLIRADSEAPYGDVQKLIEIAGTTGIYKIEVGAAKPPKG